MEAAVATHLSEYAAVPADDDGAGKRYEKFYRGLKSMHLSWECIHRNDDGRLM